MVGRRNPMNPTRSWDGHSGCFRISLSRRGHLTAARPLNSCLSMSSVPALDSIYLVSESGVFRSPARRGPGAGLSGASGYLTARETYNPPRG